MRPTLTEMLAGIESVQSTVVMPRILACGEMDVLWETGFAYRLLGFLSENGGRLLDLVIQENRDIRDLFRRISSEMEAGQQSLQDPALAVRFRQWASTLPCGPAAEECTGGEGPFLERVYRENSLLKNALNELVLLLEEANGAHPDGSAGSAGEHLRTQVRLVIRENVARQSALSEELLSLWRG